MDHKWILKRLAASSIVESLENDIVRATVWAMLGPKTKVRSHELSSQDVKTQILDRWSCALNAPSDEITDHYRAKLQVALSTLLHKYGFEDEVILHNAFDAIDSLNASVALDDHFYRQTDSMKAFLATPARPLLRRPRSPKNVTFFRSGDIVTYQLKGIFYTFYVLKIPLGNEAPLIEFFDACSQLRPEMSDLQTFRAKGAVYNDGISRVQRYWVYGSPPIPDPANQFDVIGCLPADPLIREHLAPPVAGGSVIDIFRLQRDVRELFKKES